MSAPPFDVSVEDRDRIRILVLDRPAKLNAFTAGGYRILRSELEAAAADASVAVCVLTGRGRAFSAGVDLTEMGRPGGRRELGEDFDPLLECLAGFPKPLLAAVNGVAVGFGATLLLHCDLVVVEEGAVIRMPFVALGTCAEAGSSWLLPRRVGPQQAAWMVLSGAPLDADAAVATGFALRRAPRGGALDEALELAKDIAGHEVAALVENKRLVRHGWAEAVTEAWGREKAAMMAIAEVLGSFGWTGTS